MKLRIILLIVCFCFTSAYTQSLFSEKTQNTMIAKLITSDSLTYYQCRVVDADIQVTTGNQTIESEKQQITITEKFVIALKKNEYWIRYYTSGLTVFPNRRFSGLKIRQKAYWNFSFRVERKLEDKEVEFLAVLQTVGKETTEYDFALTKHTTNQIIIKQRKTLSNF
ncbi:MAG: hypothetical protein IPJ60_03705 [Sphingobacteriaceae bacterium]|nr:hypothetical protein [Sphingobacteriaceae bacterium]